MVNRKGWGHQKSEPAMGTCTVVPGGATFCNIKSTLTLTLTLILIQAVHYCIMRFIFGSRVHVPSRSEPSGLSYKCNSNFATCLAASPVAIGFLCLLVVTPVRSALSLCLLLSKNSPAGMPLIQDMLEQPCKCNIVRSHDSSYIYKANKEVSCKKHSQM